MTTCEALDALFAQAKATAGEIAEASRSEVSKDTLDAWAQSTDGLQAQLTVALKANTSLRGLLRMAWRERDMMAARLTEVIRERDALQLKLRKHEPEPEDVADPIAAAIAIHQDKGQR